MQNHTIVTLKKGEGRTIKAGGAWISDGQGIYQSEFKDPHPHDDASIRSGD